MALIPHRRHRIRRRRRTSALNRIGLLRRWHRFHPMLWKNIIRSRRIAIFGALEVAARNAGKTSPTGGLFIARSEYAPGRAAQLFTVTGDTMHNLCAILVATFVAFAHPFSAHAQD